MTGDNVIKAFGAHDRMSVEQALESVDPSELRHVIIVGTTNDEKLYIRSSYVTCAEAVFMLREAELHAHGIFNRIEDLEEIVNP